MAENADTSSAPSMSPPKGGDSEEGGATTSHLNLSESFEEYIQHVDVGSALAFVRDGGFLQKYPRPALCRSPHSRMFQIDMDNLVLRWLSPKKNVKRTFIYLSTVITLIPGNKSAFFARKPDEQKLAFELICPRLHLRLVCPNAEEHRLWIRALVYALARAETKRRRGVLFHTKDFFRRMWDLADINASGAVTLEELAESCSRLDLQADARYVKFLFVTADTDSSGILDYIDYRSILERLIMSAQMAAHFASYRDAQRDLIRADGLRNFLLDVQGEDGTSADRAYTAFRELRSIFSEPGGTTLAGFCKLMRSEWNSLTDPDRIMNDQDMSQPLHKYWIYSVCDAFDLPQPDVRLHKTLLGALRVALLRGVRFIMAKIFVDPRDAKKIVVGRLRRREAERGYRECSFSDFLSCVKANAFKVTPYPLIIHLDFLCSPQERGTAGRCIKETLGGMLFINAQDGSVPLLEQVMKRVIISCASLQASDPDRSELTGCEADMRITRLMAEITMREVDAAGLHLLQIPPQRHPNENMPRLTKIERESVGWLSHVTGLQARALRPAESERHSFSIYGMNSALVADANATQLYGINQTSLSFCYPAGPTQIQSNRGFALALGRGFQCVALNRSAGGMAVIMQEALFELNGRCGYVRRPEIFNDRLLSPRSGKAEIEDVDTSAELTISVLEGFQLPRGHIGLDGKRDNLCPFITVGIRGLPADCKTHSTRAVINNGFNPIWGEQNAVFKIRTPSLAFLTFEVRQYEEPGSSTFLGGAAALVSCIRTGYRWVALRDPYGRIIPWAGLLVRVQIKSLRKGYSTPSTETKAANLRSATTWRGGATSPPNPKRRQSTRLMPSPANIS